MSSQQRSSQAQPGPADSGAPAVSHRHVTDESVADTLIGAVRACSPDYPPSVDYVRAALVDYVDAAQARGESPERTTAAVRFMVSTILTSAVWSGENRAQARELIHALVALCTERLAAESPERAAQPSSAFEYALRTNTSEARVVRRTWSRGIDSGGAEGGDAEG